MSDKILKCNKIIDSIDRNLIKIPWTKVTKKISIGPGSDCIDTAIWMHYMDANWTAGEEARRQLHKNVESNIEQILVTTPHKTLTIRPLASHHENYTS